MKKTINNVTAIIMAILFSLSILVTIGISKSTSAYADDSGISLSEEGTYSWEYDSDFLDFIYWGCLDMHSRATAVNENKTNTDFAEFSIIIDRRFLNIDLGYLSEYSETDIISSWSSAGGIDLTLDDIYNHSIFLREFLNCLIGLYFPNYKYSVYYNNGESEVINKLNFLSDYDIYLIAHLKGDLYVNLLGIDNENISMTNFYILSNATDYINTDLPKEIYVFASWYLESNLSHFLKIVQTRSKYSPLDIYDVMPYVWDKEVDVTYGPGGLDMITFSDLKEMYGSSSEY